jgi:hypothetical protein
VFSDRTPFRKVSDYPASDWPTHSVGVGIYTISRGKHHLAEIYYVWEAPAKHFQNRQYGQIAKVNGSHVEQKDDGCPWPPPRPAGDFII